MAYEAEGKDMKNFCAEVDAHSGFLEVLLKDRFPCSESPFQTSTLSGADLRKQSKTQGPRSITETKALSVRFLRLQALELLE